MTIDSTGQRANDPGWTKEARAGERKAKSKAAWAARWTALRRGGDAAWDFFLRNLLLWVAVAGLASVATWEWWNTARGWQKLYPAAGPFAYIGAVGAVVLFFWGFRQWRDQGRSKGEAMQWLSVTVAAYIVCVVGVFIATATAAETAKRVAEASRTELNRLIIDRDDLRARVELNDPELMQMALAQDHRTLKALVDTARGTYDMPNLDQGGGCPAPPKRFTMERLCAQANGGIDPFNGEVIPGIRSEILRGEKRAKDAGADAEALASLDAQIRNFNVVQGDETAAALGDMLSIDNAGGSALSWLLLVLSSLFLYCGGWLGDWVFERIEVLRPGSRAKAKGPS